MSDKLKPCPFCGGEAATDWSGHSAHWWTYCAETSCPVYPETRFFTSKEQAIKAWNTRAEDKNGK